MSDHSIISPSSAHRWMVCSGSAMLSKLCPPRLSGSAANRGSLMHKAAETGDFTGLTENETAMVVQYLSVLPDKNAVAWFNTELKTGMNLAAVHPLHFGTMDAAWMTTDRHLHIVDFKTGAHPVEAVGNWQLVGYAAEELAKLDKPVVGVHLGIFQPKVSRKLKYWDLTYEAAIALIAEYRAGAARCFDAPVFVEGDHCKFCPANGAVCNAVRAANNPSAKDW